MLDMLRQASDSIGTYTDALRTHVTNLNNESTEGYKALQYTFKTVFERAIRSAGGGTEDHAATNPIQFGSHIALAETRTDFSQGKLTAGGNLDLAISGQGLFPLFSPRERETVYARNGRFRINSDSSAIVDSSNRPLLGWSVDANGNPDESALVKMDVTGKSDLGWTDDGFLVSGFQAQKDAEDFNEANPTATEAVPEAEKLYQVALVNFSNPSGLERIDNTSFRESSASGFAQSPSLPGENSAGVLFAQNFENSNVFDSGETIDALAIQRAMGASLTALQLVNRQMQDIVQAIAS